MFSKRNPYGADFKETARINTLFHKEVLIGAKKTKLQEEMADIEKQQAVLAARLTQLQTKVSELDARNEKFLQERDTIIYGEDTELLTLLKEKMPELDVISCQHDRFTKRTVFTVKSPDHQLVRDKLSPFIDTENRKDIYSIIKNETPDGPTQTVHLNGFMSRSKLINALKSFEPNLVQENQHSLRR